MFVDVVDTRIEQRLVDQRIGAFSSSGAAHAGMEESFVCAVVLAIVYIGALALGAYVLYSLRCSSQHLHVATRKGIVGVEQEVSSVVLLKALSGPRSRLFDPFEISRVIVIVHVGEKLASMQPVVAMCLCLHECLLLSPCVDDSGRSVLLGRSGTTQSHRRFI